MDNGVHGRVVLGLGSSRRIPEPASSFSEPALDSSSDEKKRKEDVKTFPSNRCNIKSEDIKNIGSDIAKNAK